tara:strand:+ start:277 stop:1857 length:1581 start_codon:yes stop_codon:yes gene_type:complete
MSLIQSSSINRTQTILIILLIAIAGLVIRLVFYPYNIPISADAIDYFSYSIALARGDIFPDGYLINKFGWSIFLSPFFAISNATEMIDFMNIQRIVSMIVSIATIIPLYYFIKNFFKKEVAIIAASLFIFSPKIIENSLLGISDPLFIFLICFSIMFVFIRDSKYYYLSYIFASFAFVVRQEGILILIPLILFFFIKKDFSVKTITKIGIGIISFSLIVLLSNFLLVSDMDNISIFDTLIHATEFSEQNIVIENKDGTNEIGTISGDKTEFLKNSILKYSMYSGWILLPNLVFFVILSIVIIKKKISVNRIIIFIFLAVLSLTSLFAFGKGIEDVRYLFVLIPIYVFFSGYGIDYLYRKFRKKVFLLIIFIIISSCFFVDSTIKDITDEKKFYEDAKILIQFADGVNAYEDGGKYIKAAELHNKWPNLLPYGENRKIVKCPDCTGASSTVGYTDLKQFIFDNHDNGLTHIIVYERNTGDLVDEIFNNESKFPYLEKIYDSESSPDSIRVKIFHINYDEFKKFTIMN